ncbi:hypothetical protein PHBOTO_006630 [Pseudozyma hubeiensis]|nr:hypothetical protein PHBOTO_006630 [Pseudozyma hubeiensis]
MLFELLKKLASSVVERYGVDQEDNFPPIKVVVVEGKEDITIKISDGVEESHAARCHRNMDVHVHHSERSRKIWIPSSTHPVTSAPAGLDTVPYARLTYFGGDASCSMEGYSTDIDHGRTDKARLPTVRHD